MSESTGCCRITPSSPSLDSVSLSSSAHFVGGKEWRCIARQLIAVGGASCDRRSLSRQSQYTSRFRSVRTRYQVSRITWCVHASAIDRPRRGKSIKGGIATHPCAFLPSRSSSADVSVICDIAQLPSAGPLFRSVATELDRSGCFDRSKMQTVIVVV